jgi:hypothetical protein
MRLGMRKVGLSKAYKRENRQKVLVEGVLIWARLEGEAVSIKLRLDSGTVVSAHIPKSPMTLRTFFILKAGDRLAVVGNLNANGTRVSAESLRFPKLTNTEYQERVTEANPRIQAWLFHGQ